MTGLNIESSRRHAVILLDTLVDHGPATSAEICQRLSWTKGRFTTALSYARRHLCQELGIAIPNPVPDREWRYEATTEWQPVAEGAAHGLGAVESRLIGVLRDVRIVKPHLPKGSKDWRRANFLEKHLTHITSTLDEINS